MIREKRKMLSGIEIFKFLFLTTLNLPLPSFLVPTPFTRGGGAPPSYLKNRCPHECEILHGIRNTFESLRNVKVVYSVYLVTNSNSSQERCYGENR